MSIRKEMLQVARLAPNLLGESADLVVQFLRRQQNPDGGFRDRSGRSDLYYSVFGIDGLEALRVEWNPESMVEFLKAYGDGKDLDFVHLGCLARCWHSVSSLGVDGFSRSFRESVANRLERFRSEEGGYHPASGHPTGTAYGAFLAYAAYQDLSMELPEPLRLVQSLKFLEAEEGGWSNDRHIPKGATNSTAAVATLLRNMGMPVHHTTGQWLLRQFHPQGGFKAMDQAPVPDLLSTATALHTLAGLEVDLSALKDLCLDYIDTLWTNEGAFYGHWYEEILDTEYTFYGLLALGHLSLA